VTKRHQIRRLDAGGLIDRSRPLRFTFNGRTLQGYEGDTLASALLANGVHVVARSFKLHRPRGIMTDGPEEPHAVVTVGEGTLRTPNLKATEVRVHEGLVASSQNCWPSVDRDFGAAAGLLSPLLGAGFYYKTFMAPQGAWTFYERFIRRAAGMGRAPDGMDPDAYEHRHHSCDVLIIGGGPAGLAAAARLAGSGLRLVLCDERFVLGGMLQTGEEQIEGDTGAAWARATAERVRASDGARVLENTTAVWLGEDGLVTLLERCAPAEGIAQRLWFVRARQIVVATGAIERPLCFPGNDRPGVMLASAVGAYRHRYGVALGSRAVLHANNDSGYRCLAELAGSGVNVAAVVDLRPDHAIGDAARAAAGAVPIHAASRIVATSGRARLRQAAVAGLGDDRANRHIDADLLCVAGGWSPTVHLLAHRGTPARYDEDVAAFLARPEESTLHLAGSAAGSFSLADCLGDGVRAAEAVLSALGRLGTEPATVPAAQGNALPPGIMGGPWCAARTHRERRKAFVDLQNDVTAADLASAIAEGYDAIEHLKRYTTTGMGTDQGKLGNVLAIGIVAEMTGRAIGEIGHTTFRPPYTPVSFGALVGAHTGGRLLVTRRTPFHARHLASGAVMEPAGAWLYPKCYPRAGEDLAAAIHREVLAVRNGVGIVDMATLGKFELHGPDAGLFLDRVYANRLSGLAVGRCRYAVMLREDGVVFDDGTVTRMAENVWHITATTGHAGSVHRHLTRLLEVVWPGLDVTLVDVSEQWAGLAVAGPNSREVLQDVLSDGEADLADLPFMGFREVMFGSRRARLYRISYSGERAYELFVGADAAEDLWDAVMRAGAPYDICPYGYEALDVLRIEKGHLAESELDGRNFPGDLGLARLIKEDRDFLGSALMRRYGPGRPSRSVLVGLAARDGASRIPGGAVLVDAQGDPGKPIGHVTATVVSPTLGHPIAMAMLDAAFDQGRDSLTAVSPAFGLKVEVQLVPMPFVDPKGKRVRA
jgi:heterotetrameric sarcosine oxidase alpha subunit